MNSATYKVGDKIINFGEVFRIFEIKKRLNTKGSSERVIYFRPYYDGASSSAIVCSVPLENIEMTLIRRPLTKEQIKECLDLLKTRKIKDSFKDINQAKQLLGTNRLIDTTKFLIYLLNEFGQVETVSRSKRDIFDKAKERFVQEWALVFETTLEKARKKIDPMLEY